MLNPSGARAASAAMLLASTLTVVGVLAPPASAAPVRDTSSFACAPGLTTGFTDIAGTTHEPDIACAVHYELTGGTTATTYTPDGTVTRGQMATFIMRLFGFFDIQPGEFQPTGFTDIAGDPHEGSIEGIVELGIAQGTSPTTFAPNEAVSRAQMGTFLLHTLELAAAEPAPAEEDAFDDDDGNPHEAAIQAIAEAGIAGGTAPRVYEPSTPVTRGAMASFLVRTVDVLIEQAIFAPFVESTTFAALAGSEEVPGPGDPDGTGTAVVVTTDVPGVLCVFYEVDDLDPPTAAHIHDGDPGEAGDPVVELPVPTGGELVATCLSDDDADAIGADPGAFYLNVHTEEFPDGAIRGQLGEIGVQFATELEGEDVFPGPGDAGAFGFIDGFTTSQPDVLCTSVFALTEGDVSVGHLHEGLPHTNGPVVVDLEVLTVDDLESASARLDLQCQYTPSAADVADDPSQFYVEVHTEDFPDGALRGQLDEGAGGFFSAGTAFRIR